MPTFSKLHIRIRRARLVPSALGLWLSTLLSAHAGWTLQSSEKIETASPAVTLVHKTLAGEHTVEIYAVFFNTKDCALRVIDHPGESGTLDDAMKANGCLAGVNGNYFHPDRTSLGLVISDGQQIHAAEKARLLSGILTARPGHLSLVRYAEFTADAAITQALQAGPFLIDHGKPVEGLEATRRAARTIVVSDGQGHGVLLSCHSATLAEMGAILATPGIIDEMRIDRALNLDGGSSTALWVATKSAPFYLPELDSVRNYLALVPRGK